MKRKKITETMVRSANELREYLEELAKRIEVVEEQVDHRYQPHESETANLTQTARECICTHRMFPDPDCPLHGWVAIFKGQKATYDRLHKTPARTRCNGCGRVSDITKLDQFWTCPFCTPDPLHVRVAKANGKEVKHIKSVGGVLDGWRYWNPGTHGGARWVLIPRCDKIVDEAMGALEEYCKDKMFGRIEHFPQSMEEGYKWYVKIDEGSGSIGGEIGKKFTHGNSLPTVICEAICAHAEAK